MCRRFLVSINSIQFNSIPSVMYGREIYSKVCSELVKLLIFGWLCWRRSDRSDSLFPDPNRYWRVSNMLSRSVKNGRHVSLRAVKYDIIQIFILLEQKTEQYIYILKSNNEWHTWNPFIDSFNEEMIWLFCTSCWLRNDPDSKMKMHRSDFISSCLNANPKFHLFILKANRKCFWRIGKRLTSLKY